MLSRRATAVAALAAAIACGGRSEHRAPDPGVGATGATASGGSASGRQGAEGANGGTAARAAGGLVGTGGSAAGSSAGYGGATAGASGMPGGGIAGDIGGRPGRGGAAGGSRGGVGGNAGSPSTIWAPLWLPTGAFGEAAQHVVDATTEYVFYLCLANQLPFSDCTLAELHNFAPSLEWLACASRGPDADRTLEDLAAQFFACAAEQRQCGCGIVLCNVTIPDAPGCPPYQSQLCPNGETFAYRCDDNNSVELQRQVRSAKLRSIGPSLRLRRRRVHCLDGRVRWLGRLLERRG